MGYEVVLYITKDETTEKFFHRFQKVNIRDRVWEVQMVNDITSDTMLIIYLKETFTNEFDPVTNELPDGVDTQLVDPEIPDVEEQATAAIIGDDIAYPFDNKQYSIRNVVNGIWVLSNSKAKIEESTSTDVTIVITSAKSGSVDLIYRRENEDDIVKHITIKSL